MAIQGQRFGQELQGNGALQPGVLGLLDHAHASAAELLQDPVVRHRLPDHVPLMFLTTGNSLFIKIHFLEQGLEPWLRAQAV